MTIKCEYVVLLDDKTWDTVRNVRVEVDEDAESTWFETAGESDACQAVAESYDRHAITAYPWCVPQDSADDGRHDEDGTP